MAWWNGLRAKIWLLPALTLLLAVATGVAVKAQGESAFSNPVEALQAKLDNGEAHLVYADNGHGYLKSLLDALHIPVDSQLLIFSRSSLQFDLISPKTPRAIYFQDGASVGTVQNGRVLEVLAIDSHDGIAFYTLDTKKVDKPHFERQTGECIICHGFASRWAAGMMVGNIFVDAGGQPASINVNNLFHLTDDRTPFDQRWAGWYVTGQSGVMKHNANVTTDTDHPFQVPAGGLNITDLSGKLDVSHYLQPGSDIVSLLTLEHQTGVVNLITRINAQYRGLDNTGVIPALRATQQDIDASIEELAADMTFADAVPLPSPVTGSSGFTQTFPDEGPRDPQGRSLRDFDLKTRLFRYPLSYMIYSRAFDSLYPIARDRVWRRLYDILSGADKSAHYQGIAARGGAAAIAIVAATRTGLPAYWKTPAAR